MMRHARATFQGLRIFGAHRAKSEDGAQRIVGTGRVRSDQRLRPPPRPKDRVAEELMLQERFRSALESRRSAVGKCRPPDYPKSFLLRDEGPAPCNSQNSRPLAQSLCSRRE